jgi:hypothetical protein
MRVPRVAVLVLAAFLAGACASWRWSGSPKQAGRSPVEALKGAGSDETRHPAAEAAAPAAAGEINVSTTPVERPVVPPTPDDRFRSALFYSDLGADEVDVSNYPAQQRYNYGVYQRACSRCHTLARSINAPLVSRGWWEFYILGMRMRSNRQGRPLAKDEVSAILDFLEYDSRARKVEDAHRFDLITEELKARFDRSLSRRLRDLQKANPRPLNPRR